MMVDKFGNKGLQDDILGAYKTTDGEKPKDDAEISNLK